MVPRAPAQRVVYVYIYCTKAVQVHLIVDNRLKIFCLLRLSEDYKNKNGFQLYGVLETVQPNCADHHQHRRSGESSSACFVSEPRGFTFMMPYLLGYIYK